MTIREYVAQFDHEIVGKLRRVKKDEPAYDKRYITYVDEAGNTYDINKRTKGICVSTEDGCI
jgi:hypothetical protein